MTLPASDLRRLVERASLLYERLSPDFTPEQLEPEAEESARRRVKAWKQHVALGDDDRFAKRLEWDGLTYERAVSLFGGVRLNDGALLPDWALCLSASLACVPESKSYVLPDDPIPFEHAFAGFVGHWERSVSGQCPEGWGLLGEDARISLRRCLVRKLSQAGSSTLHLEFSTFLAMGTWVSDEIDPYQDYIRTLNEGGLVSLFNRYPVLARLLAKATYLFTQFAGQFLERLVEDLGSIRDEFSNGREVGKISEIRTGLSDSHNGGTTVLRISFEQGTTCYYKPKNIDSEGAYYKLLGWFNQSGAMLPFMLARTICREEHGWAEEVTSEPCANQEAAERYFQRAGMLLAILYVLGANDCNMENIIACGEHPVLIDTETFFQPFPSPITTDQWEAASLADRSMYHNSVLRVGMLPRWSPGPNGSRNDINGLGGLDGERGKVNKKIWKNINTGLMRAAWEQTPIDPGLVHILDKPVFAADYAGSVSAGFATLYQFLLEKRDEFIMEGGPLSAMAELRLRFLVRSTYIYYGVMQKALVPQNQSDGIDASIQVDGLARRFLSAEQRPISWGLIAEESASLLQLDIPRFASTPRSTGLEIARARWIDGFFIEPSLLSVYDRIAALTEADLELQTSYIRCSFARPYPIIVSDSSESAVAPDEGGLTASDALDEAQKIAERISKDAIRASDGTVTWVTHGYHPDSQIWQIQPMGMRLFDGVCGTGLFLAAMHRASPGSGFDTLASSTFHMIANISDQQARRWLQQNGLGAGLGYSSLTCALFQASRSLDDERLTAAAVRLTRLITREDIAVDKKLDILGGVAGCILVTLRLFEATRDARLAEIAVLCGDHLVAQRSDAGNGLRSWATIGGKYLAGFSHGAAGMSYSLSRLTEVLGERRFKDAALEATGYEATLFNERENNWPNLLAPMKEGGYAFWNSWCHGAPGIGLARVGSLATSDSSEYRRDIAHGVKSASDAPLNSLDNLCCGTLGRLDVLLEAHRVLGEGQCLDRARQLAKAVVVRAAERGGYVVGPQTGIYVPSLYQGMAGVGYQLLRVANPSAYPSVLCFQ